MGLIKVYTLVTRSYKELQGEEKVVFEENISWRDFCIGSENVFIGTTDSVNTSVSLASSMRSARETEVWIERDVALCFLERKIETSD